MRVPRGFPVFDNQLLKDYEQESILVGLELRIHVRPSGILLLSLLAPPNAPSHQGTGQAPPEVGPPGAPPTTVLSPPQRPHYPDF